MENIGPQLNQPATSRMLRRASNSLQGPPPSHDHNRADDRHAMLPQHDTLGLLPSAPISLPDPATHMKNSHNQPQGQPGHSQHSHQSLQSHQGHQSQHQPKASQNASGQPPLQQFHRKSIGDWDFVRTIGAGSMGKVKLARHTESGEKCAVKIVPRAAKLYQRAHANDPPVKSSEEAAQRQKEFEKEIARDKRTIREGALGRLLFHPHICRLYEIVPMTNHYYMLFEYVEGGQLLDYIVSHGSLNEKYARKFARGIASALDYCHKNNVVHRDLKIENIMINSKGEIKIIDFGLSNLYMPHHLLKTYCGSLYFAAPELLSAKPYVGPEVDVWSFGVVLYVLVCGKVPFDDPVVSALHEKIKKGHVEYPAFISKECASLLSRMLVVDPTKRATLAEVILHPWMNIGHDHLTPSYTPERVPLSLPLDPEILKAIAQFDLGSVSFVTEELTKVISSPEYQLGCDNWYKYAQAGKKPPPGNNITHGFHPLVSIYYLVDEVRKRKRAKDEAIKKHLHEQAHAPLEAPNSAASSLAILSSGALRLSSPRPPLADNLHPPKYAHQTLNPGSPNPQRSHSISNAYTREGMDTRPEPLVSTPKQPSSQHEQVQPGTPQNIPQLSYPEPVHTPTMPRSMNKASSPADFENQYTTQTPVLQNPPETLDPNGGKSLGLNNLLRRLSSKKSKSPVSKASSPTKESPLPARFPLPVEDRSPMSPADSPQSSLASSKRDPMMRRGVSMKITAKEKSSGSRVNLQNEQLGKQRDQEKEEPRYKTHVHSASTSGKPHNFIPVEYLPPLPNIDPKQMDGSVSFAPSKPNESSNRPPNIKKFHPNARAKSVGSHVLKDLPQGKSSMARPILPDAMALQNSDEGIDENVDMTDTPHYDDVALSEGNPTELPALSEEQIIQQFNHAKRNSMPSIEYPKTLFLKGFFSVQTTSTKPLPVIRYNILKVLSRLGVRFQEVKGGFMCVHSVYTPARELDADQDDAHYANAIIDGYKLDDNSEDTKYNGQSPRSSETESNTPEYVLRSSQNTDHSQHSSDTSKPSLQVITSPNTTGYVKGHRSSNSTSNAGHRRKFSVGQTFLQNYRKKNGSQTLMPPNTPASARLTKLLLGAMELDDEDLDEETRMQLQQLADDDSVDSLSGIMIGGGSDMLVSSRIEQRAKHHRVSLGSDEDGLPKKKTPLKFEINIVKVPLVGLYGVQFKKTLGNTWSYKTLAGQILKDLNL
ncbi:hypothetical protein PUMCH_001007 [Australozyma saopauloensis]|uniref:non-specific serine/threonine protein kinase n=1 Tax=Australozyma saopauloensis TaxID=291208 RepID=A0AAX4H5G6_9ASCO|nr:hypothetical protein PUMCH_001007 [[Candida] saopauloensis]